MLSSQVEQLLDNSADFSRKLPAAGNRRVFLAEHPAAQRLATIGMRRTPVRIVPGRSPSVADLLLAFVPCPQFDQGVHPQVQMPSADVRPEVTDLLLAIGSRGAIGRRRRAKPRGPRRLPVELLESRTVRRRKRPRPRRLPVPPRRRRLHPQARSRRTGPLNGLEFCGRLPSLRGSSPSTESVGKTSLQNVSGAANPGTARHARRADRLSCGVWSTASLMTFASRSGRPTLGRLCPTALGVCRKFITRQHRWAVVD
jgi:hypothetical protein